MIQEDSPQKPSSSQTPPPQIDSEGTEVGSVFVSNYPPFSFWKSEHLPAVERLLDTPPADDVPLGLYLHIPFCRRRCKFCYFRVYIDKNAEQIQSYLDALGREVELLASQPAVAGRPLRFVYFGGGTPSYVAVKHLEGLLERVKAALPWDAVEEVTFECEPGTLSQSKVAAYRELGITRLSLGIEHWNDDILRENGRAHLSAEIERCLPWIREQGFAQLNVDLIAGMVGESWETWRDAVRKTIEVDPDSVTIYQMELPFNTLYSQDILDGAASPVADWATKRAWHDWAIDELQAAGYEISSAYTMVKRSEAPDARFVYRDALWQGADLLGTGVASFSHFQGTHFQNVSSWAEYLGALEDDRLPLGRALPVADAERLTRELILQMKLGRLDLGYFRRKFGVDPMERWGDVFAGLAEREMLRLDNGTVELTRRGLLQVDALLPGFYDPRYRNARYT